ncbi:Dehydrocurvularin biosynthesis regulator [Fusarium oxysporum f. sp. albedinis]|nr:Dehydrocurvularin biosynthesis regulator [Fusarium oxysporum f. sp. albedinis]
MNSSHRDTEEIERERCSFGLSNFSFLYYVVSVPFIGSNAVSKMVAQMKTFSLSNLFSDPIFIMMASSAHTPTPRNASAPLPFATGANVPGVTGP